MANRLRGLVKLLCAAGMIVCGTVCIYSTTVAFLGYPPAFIPPELWKRVGLMLVGIGMDALGMLIMMSDSEPYPYDEDL